jgi:hypothetical protein
MFENCCPLGLVLGGGFCHWTTRWRCKVAAFGVRFPLNLAGNCQDEEREHNYQPHGHLLSCVPPPLHAQVMISRAAYDENICDISLYESITAQFPLIRQQCYLLPVTLPSVWQTTSAEASAISRAPSGEFARQARRDA